MVLISSVLGLLGPFLVGMAIDDYIVTKDSGGLISLLFGLLASLYILFTFHVASELLDDRDCTGYGLCDAQSIV